MFTAVRQSFALLSTRARRRYSLIVAAQMATGLLDLLGVALIGLMGLAATSAVSGDSTTLDTLPGLAGWEEADPMQLAVILAVAAAVALLARSIAYGVLLRLNYRLLAQCQVEATSTLLARLMRRPLADIQAAGSQHMAYALMNGAGSAITGLLGSLSVILTDCALLVLLGVGLFVVSPAMTLAAGLYLGLVAVVVHFSLSRWSERNGAELGGSGVANMMAIQEGLGLHRELWTMGRLGQRYELTRSSLEVGARARGTQTLIGQIPRMIYDSALVIGALLLTAWQLRTSSLSEAMATLLVFLAAASRVLPSLMRVNSQLIQMRSYSGQGRQTYVLAASLQEAPSPGWREPSLEPLRATAADASAADAAPHAGAHVLLRGVSYTYPGTSEQVLSDVSLEALPGGSIAVVGPTGGGKSTLADVIVGLLVPGSGEVTIDGLPPLDMITARPGALAYVPQRVFLVDGSVRDNVTIDLDPALADDDRVWHALRQAHVSDVIAALPDGIDTRIGEHGLRLSGGQRQRLGLARALYSGPSLLVLDEATSALDAETEQAIASGLDALRGSVTVIVIAHRLAAVKGADRVVYLDKGRVAGAGSFEELVLESADFARQVDILSLPNGRRHSGAQAGDLGG